MISVNNKVFFKHSLSDGVLNIVYLMGVLVSNVYLFDFWSFPHSLSLLLRYLN